MTTKKSYKKTDLDKYIKEQDIELIGQYEKVTRDSKIQGKCKTEKCDEIFLKSFRTLITLGGPHCKKCVKVNKTLKTETTNIERYGCISPFHIKEVKQQIDNNINSQKIINSQKFIKESNQLHNNKYDYSYS